MEEALKIAVKLRSSLIKKRIYTGLLLFFLFALSCQKEDQEKEILNEGTRTDTLLVIDQFILPEGKTEVFPSGFEVVANNGINIQGEILIKPEREGDFTIRCLKGDMILDGRIRVDTAGVGTKSQSGLGQLKAGDPGNRVGLNFFLESTGHLILDKNFEAIAGAGQHAADIAITGGELDDNGTFKGREGTNGGDIIVNSQNGYIFFYEREESSPPMFSPGNGGNGADLIVETQTFNTSADKLELLGGNGGNSGFVQITAKEISGLGNIPTSALISNGSGGKGGDVIWDVSGFLSKEFTGADTRFSLKNIRFRGGKGGDGLAQGGDGGDAIYLSYKVINYVGSSIASVEVTGGDGGNVKADYSNVFLNSGPGENIPFPLENVYGGNGGGVIALGNMGWDGVPAHDGGHIDGASGGDVSARGGNGGHVEEGVIFLEEARGGNGGQPNNRLLASGLFLARYHIPDANGDFTSIHYGVIAGSGGKGASDCEGCPGGNGGNAGRAEAIGGNGGNAPHVIGGRGGYGGDVWTAASFSLQNASGGDGNPPGNGGQPGEVIISPGKGGLAYQPGENGNHVGILQNNPQPAPDGMLCGEGFECESDSSDNGGNNEDCHLEMGATYTAHYEIESIGDHGNGYTTSLLQSWNETGIRVENGWMVEGNSHELSSNSDGDSRDTTYSYSGLINIYRPPAITKATRETLRPKCFEGETLYFPGKPFSYTVQNNYQGTTYTTTYKLSVQGCNPLPFWLNGSNNPADWECCNGEAVFTGGNGCPL